MSSWNKKELKLSDKHLWKAKPGHKIFVADRGAVRFDVPADWVIVPEDDSIKIFDKQPPDDDCCLASSYIRLPPLDFSGLPIAKMLHDVLHEHKDDKEDEREITKIGRIIEHKRGNMDIAWCEQHFIDPKEKRPAISRICIARRNVIQCLITFDFWVSDLDRCRPVWNTVIESLVLDQIVANPLTGF